MTHFTYIYTLTDPRDGLIYYVGRTNSPKRRNWEHRNKSKALTYSPWHQELLAAGLRPLMEVVEEVSGTGVIAERMWIAKLREDGHPLVNSWRFIQGPIGEGKTTFRGKEVMSAEEVRQWRARDIQSKWQKWWDSLPAEEKSRRQRNRTNAKSRQAGRDFWSKMSPEERQEFCRKRWERMSPENRAKVLAGNKK